MAERTKRRPRSRRARRRDEQSLTSSKQFQGWVTNIQQGMSDLYATTYMSSRENIDDMQRIADDIEDNISAIIRRNSDNDIAGISKMYSRLALKNATNDRKLQDQLKELFGDDGNSSNLLSAYMANKWIHDLDIEIDTVLKYCTKMNEAIKLLKDAVMCSDSTTKDTVMFRTNTSDNSELAIFNARSKALNKKYDFTSKAINWYLNTSKYGEQFVYVVPYNRAITKLLQQQNRKTISSIVSEGGSLMGDFATGIKLSPDTKLGDFRVEIDTGRSLRSALDQLQSANEAVENMAGSSMYEQFIMEAWNQDPRKKKEMDQTIANDIQLPKDFDDSSSDGFIDTRKPTDIDSSKLKTKGAVVQDLKHENLIPLYIQDTCMGYYYLEFNNTDGFNFYNTMLDKYGKGYEAQAISPITKSINDGMLATNTDNILKKVANKISRTLDATFINANLDITKEIYSILKYNNVYDNKAEGPESMKISFLPPEDVHMLTFNLDEDTHRGQSDCLDGLIPGKLFACMYITNSTGILTRGQDKRVYYVKQTIDTNISQTLLNVINQVKKSNFNIRQIENMNNVLNVVGRFNDYFIPVGPSGDSPIQFEVMPGQQFEINSDLYNMLEEMAVNSILPIEMVNARMQPEFAVQYSGTHLQVLRLVYNRQSVMEEFLSGIFTKIYNCEYPDEMCDVECMLPPPISLAMTNTTQLINNVTEYVKAQAEYEYGGEPQEVQDREMPIFIRKMMKHILASYVKPTEVDRFKREAKVEAKESNSEEEQ